MERDYGQRISLSAQLRIEVSQMLARTEEAARKVAVGYYDAT
jgi:hypothetical protein